MGIANLDSNAVATATSIGKDFVSLLRDGALLVLAVLLVAFPAQLNSILIDAGFEEGSVVGFKWKSKLVESDQALKAAQDTIDALQRKNDELVFALADANGKVVDPKRVELIARLEQDNKALKVASQIVQDKVEDSIKSNAPLVDKAEKVMSSNKGAQVSRKKSDFVIGLQTLGVEDSDRVALNGALSADGYGLDAITWSYPTNQRPSWFANRSTVFYYSGASRATAEQLAEFMKMKTGQVFAVQRGNGLGVDPSRRDVTLFVHFIKGK